MSQQFNIVAKLQLQGPSNVGGIVSQLRNQLRGVNATVGLNTTQATAGLQKVSQGAMASAQALRAMQAQAGATAATLAGTIAITGSGANAFRNFAEQAGLAARRFIAFSVAAGGLLNAIRGIKEGVRAAVDFELALNKVEQVSSETRSSVAALRNDIGSLAVGLGVSSAALAETALTLKQAGLSVNQTRDALKALALTDLAPTFDGMKQSTEGLIAAFRQFNLQSTQFETTLSSMNAVSAQFAVESSDIITAVQKAGGAFKLTAGDMKSGSEALNEFMALFTSVRATTRESADQIATGLRTVFTRFQRADTVKALQDLGINLRYTREEARALGQTNMTDQFVGAYEAVRRLSEGLAGLRETDPRYAQVVEQLGGYRQISRVIPLLKEFKTAEEAKNVAIAGGISLQVAAEKRQETLANRIDKLKESYLELFRSITQDKSFQGLASTLLFVASSFAKLVDMARPLLPLLIGIAAVKLGANVGNIAGGFARSFVAPPGSLVAGGGRGALPTRFASGGFVPGSGNNDTEPALLMPGEFVLNKQAVAKFGVPNLRDANEGRARLRINRYATGSVNPVGGSYEELRRRVEEQRAVVQQREAASEAAVQRANKYEKDNTQKAGYGEPRENKPSYDPKVVDQLGQELDALAADFRAAREELRQLTVAMHAAKGEVAPKLAVYQDDGRGRPKVLEEFSELGTLEEANNSARSLANRQFRGGVEVETGKALAPGSKEYGYSARRGGESVYVGYAPGAAPGTPLPGAEVAKQAAAEMGQTAKDIANAFKGAGEGFKAAANAKQQEYADRIKAGADPEKVLQGLGPKTRESVMALVNPPRAADDEEVFSLSATPARPSSPPPPRSYSKFDDDDDEVFTLSATPVRANVKPPTQEAAVVAQDAAIAAKQVPAAPAPVVPSLPAVSSGQDRLARLRSRQPATPKPTDDIQALSFVAESPIDKVGPAGSSKPVDEKFTYVGAQVNKDSSASEAAREKAAREFFDKQNAPATPAAADTSYLSQLKTDEQKAFFAKYTNAKPVFTKSTQKGNEGELEFAGTKPGLADSVAYFKAQKSGDIGRAGLASGVVEDAAREAVAKLAVDPPEDFDPNHPKASGYVARYVSNAVGNRLTTEYGTKASKFGGYIAKDGEGNIIDPVGRESEPGEAPDADRLIAEAKAREQERAQQLAKVKSVLPGGEIPTDRDGRFATLRSLGSNYKDASAGAAEKRFDETVAGKVREKLGIEPPTPGTFPPAAAGAGAGTPPPPKPPTDFVGPQPGDNSGRPRDGYYTVPLKELPEFARALGLNVQEFAALAAEVREAAEQLGQVGHLDAGLSDATVKVVNGGARGVGVRQRASVVNPLATEVNDYVDKVEGRVVSSAAPGSTVGLGGGKYVVSPANKQQGLTDAEREYQNQQLFQDRQKNGAPGMSYDELAAAAREQDRKRAERAARRNGPSPAGRNVVVKDGKVVSVEGGQGRVSAVDLAINQRAAGATLATQYTDAKEEYAQERAAARPRTRYLPGRPLLSEAQDAARRQGANSPEAIDEAVQKFVARRVSGAQTSPEAISLLGQSKGVLPDDEQSQLEDYLRTKGLNTLPAKGAGLRVKGMDTFGNDTEEFLPGQTENGFDTRAYAKRTGKFVIETEEEKGTQLRQGTAVNRFVSQFEEQTDAAGNKFRKQTGGLLGDRVDALTKKRLDARGGADNLSDKTKDAIRQEVGHEEEQNLRRELISAQSRLLAAINPQMSATERYTKAVEDAEKAMAGLATVAKDHEGKVLGLSETVDKATDKGVSAPGAGGARYAVGSAVGNAYNAARNRLLTPTKLGKKLDGMLAVPGVGTAFAGAGVAAALIGDKFTQGAGSVEDAARNENAASSYRTDKAIGGGLQGIATGAAMGAALGSVVPVIGTAIGGLAGGIAGGTVGVIKALDDAEGDIRNAKISAALNELGDKLNAFATGIPDSAALAGIRLNMSEYRSQSTERAKDAASSIWNAFRPSQGASFTEGLGSTFDSKQYLAQLNSDIRKEFGPLMPQMFQGLSKQAEKLGKDNPQASLDGRDGLVSRLSGGGDGVNREFIRIIAQLQNIPVEQVEKQFRKTLVSAQQQGRIEAASRASRQGQEQSTNSFVRLFNALQGAADSLGTLQQRASALTDALDGTVSATKVSALGDRLENGLGRADGSGLAALDIVANATGEQGGRVRSAGQAANAVQAQLASVLTSALADRRIESDSIPTAVADGLYRQMGYARAQDAPESIQRVVATVRSELGELGRTGGEGAVQEEARTDVSRLTERLISKATDPVVEFGRKNAGVLEERANQLIEGLTSLHQRLQSIGQLYDQLASTRASSARQLNQFAYENAGRRGQALDGMTVGELEGGFNARQTRLAGVGDGRAFDPAFLGQQLAQVRAQIGPAVQRQQRLFESPEGGGGRSPAFVQAADEVLRLKTQAANLQQALKHLADTAERNAVIQEKLNRLKEEEDGRLSVAERFAQADPTEQARMNRGFELADQAARAGNLDGFETEDRRSIIDTLRGAGGVTLTGFEGAPRADDLLRNLLGNSFGGTFRLTEAQQEERAGLQGEAVNRGSTAEAAVQQLIQHQEAGSTQFFQSLAEQHNQFFSRLERSLLLIRQQDAQNGYARASAAVNDLRTGQGRSAGLLARVGVTTTAQVEAVRGRAGDLRNAIVAQQADRQRVAGATNLLNEYGPNTGGSNLATWVSRSGMSEEQQQRVRARAQQLNDSRPYQNGEARLRRETAPDQLPAAIDGLRRRAITQALAEEGERDTGDVSAARDRLRGIRGVNADAISSVLSGTDEDASAFLRAFESFDSSGNRVEDFGRKLTTAEAELARFEAQLRSINAAVGPAAPGAAAPLVTRAGGGDIFKPMGTDTVPAMLTPGEFVVNARSSAANAALLHQINEARGAVRYLDGGGFALPDPVARRLPEDLTRSYRQESEAYDERTRQRRRRVGLSPEPLSDTRIATLANPTGRLSQLEAERAARERVAARQQADDAAHEARRASVERDRVRLRDLDGNRREGTTSNSYSVIGGGNLSGAALVGAETSAQNSEEATRARVRRFQERDSAESRARRAQANAAAQQQAGDTAAGDLVAGASIAAFNRQAFQAHGVRRPGDEGQRNIATKDAAGLLAGFEKRFSTSGSLRRYTAARVSRFADGGVVPGAGITDTVPALLTPGEGVLTASATARLGAKTIAHFNRGGVVGNVNYLADGGKVQGGAGGSVGFSPEAVQAMTTLSGVLNSFVQASGGFGQAAQQLAQTFNVFAGQAQALTQAMANMPRSLTITGTHQVNVTFNGAEVLAKLTPEIQQMVTTGIKSELGRVFKEQMPDAGINVQ